MTEWPSDQVTKWPSDQVTKWQEASQTIDRMVYFEALLITTYLVLEIQLHTLLADLRDDLLLRQAAADELQRDEHLQLSFSLWSSFLTSTLLLPVIMQYQFYDLDDKCSWVLPRLIHFLNIDIKIDTQYPKKTHK